MAIQTENNFKTANDEVKETYIPDPFGLKDKVPQTKNETEESDVTEVKYVPKNGYQGDIRSVRSYAEQAVTDVQEMQKLDEESRKRRFEETEKHFEGKESDPYYVEFYNRVEKLWPDITNKNVKKEDEGVKIPLPVKEEIKPELNEKAQRISKIVENRDVAAYNASNDITALDIMSYFSKDAAGIEKAREVLPALYPNGVTEKALNAFKEYFGEDFVKTPNPQEEAIKRANENIKKAAETIKAEEDAKKPKELKDIFKKDNDVKFQDLPTEELVDIFTQKETPTEDKVEIYENAADEIIADAIAKNSEEAIAKAEQALVEENLTDKEKETLLAVMKATGATEADKAREGIAQAKTLEDSLSSEIKKLKEQLENVTDVTERNALDIRIANKENALEKAKMLKDKYTNMLENASVSKDILGAGREEVNDFNKQKVQGILKNYKDGGFGKLLTKEEKELYKKGLENGTISKEQYDKLMKEHRDATATMLFFVADELGTGLINAAQLIKGGSVNKSEYQKLISSKIQSKTEADAEAQKTMSANLAKQYTEITNEMSDDQKRLIESIWSKLDPEFKLRFSKVDAMQQLENMRHIAHTFGSEWSDEDISNFIVYALSTGKLSAGQALVGLGADGINDLINSFKNSNNNTNDDGNSTTVNKGPFTNKASTETKTPVITNGKEVSVKSSEAKRDNGVYGSVANYKNYQDAMKEVLPEYIKEGYDPSFIIPGSIKTEEDLLKIIKTNNDFVSSKLEDKNWSEITGSNNGTPTYKDINYDAAMDFIKNSSTPEEKVQNSFKVLINYQKDIPEDRLGKIKKELQSGINEYLSTKENNSGSDKYAGWEVKFNSDGTIKDIYRKGKYKNGKPSNKADKNKKVERSVWRDFYNTFKDDPILKEFINGQTEVFERKFPFENAVSMFDDIKTNRALPDDVYAMLKGENPYRTINSKQAIANSNLANSTGAQA